MKSTRKLKIHTKFRRRTWDHTTVPEIRLEGRWLEELGFEEGKTIKVIQEKRFWRSSWKTKMLLSLIGKGVTLA